MYAMTPAPPVRVQPVADWPGQDRPGRGPVGAASLPDVPDPNLRAPATELRDHPDRLRWNARYGSAGDRMSGDAGRMPHPWAARALAAPAPDGPVADLACGLSGAVLVAGQAGRRAIGVDISEVALRLLGAQVERRGLTHLVTLVHADLRGWRPPPERFAVLLCTGYWDRDVFGTAAGTVARGGLIAWEAFTAAARRTRPDLPAAWCLEQGEPASLLPTGFEIVDVRDVPGNKRRLLARAPG